MAVGSNDMMARSGTTVRVALLLVTLPEVAVILVVPTARPEVQPTLGLAATLVLLLAQVTEAVMFW